MNFHHQNKPKTNRKPPKSKKKPQSKTVNATTADVQDIPSYLDFIPYLFFFFPSCFGNAETLKS